ncbi:hypothetical protein CROQUDRAFT_103449 [Cronartium quercuum f. sp. fusiforme G11]|uniref:Uncharacterized protein n=1 Tax=Cronartium quercuum f. sp. fusiforme G11 TaxID=708437 RepID=A0A9P6NQZ7_9BASI|nr:hypothetical protein CROQUDRAFT_103449 [Cronartium quercuum f. sp. fusiforme G11]
MFYIRAGLELSYFVHIFEILASHRLSAGLKFRRILQHVPMIESDEEHGRSLRGRSIEFVISGNLGTDLGLVRERHDSRSHDPYPVRLRLRALVHHLPIPHLLPLRNALVVDYQSRQYRCAVVEFNKPLSRFAMRKHDAYDAILTGSPSNGVVLGVHTIHAGPLDTFSLSSLSPHVFVC